MFTIPRPENTPIEKTMQLHEYMGTRRLITLAGVIGDYTHAANYFSAAYIADEILALNSLSHDPIHLIIDTQGGSIRDGLLLVNVMALVESPVYTIAKKVYSMGAVILASGEQGHRYVFPSSHGMLHLPSGGFGGDSKQIELAQADFEKTKEQLLDHLLACGVKRDREAFLIDIDRERWMYAQDIIDYGLADAMVPPGLLLPLIETPPVELVVQGSDELLAR